MKSGLFPHIYRESCAVVAYNDHISCISWNEQTKWIIIHIIKNCNRDPEWDLASEMTKLWLVIRDPKANRQSFGRMKLFTLTDLLKKTWIVIPVIVPFWSSKINAIDLAQRITLSRLAFTLFYLANRKSYLCSIENGRCYCNCPTPWGYRNVANVFGLCCIV